MLNQDAEPEDGRRGEAKYAGGGCTRGDAPMGTRGRRGHTGAQGASRRRGTRLSPEQTSLLLKQTAAPPGNAIIRRRMLWEGGGMSICCCICGTVPRKRLRGVEREGRVQVQDAEPEDGGCGQAKYAGGGRTQGDAPMGARGRWGHAGAQGASRRRGARLSPKQTSLLLEQTAASPSHAKNACKGKGRKAA